jgi:phosphoribosylamine-glycine ligase
MPICARKGNRSYRGGSRGALDTGIADRFNAEGLLIFGPSAAAARLEGSKFSPKTFLKNTKSDRPF